MRKLLTTLIILLCLATALTTNARTSRFVRRHRLKFSRVFIKLPRILPHLFFNTDSVTADSLLHFAQSLIGTPYRSATSNPDIGFDCSGFVSYVFKSFNFAVPRSSCEYINVGEKIRLEDARPGDIILFTGTSRHDRRIGHIGIVYCNDCEEMKFIHSTSGKEHGVTITAMDENYKRRYVQIIRLLKQNNG